MQACISIVVKGKRVLCYISEGLYMQSIILQSGVAEKVIHFYLDLLEEVHETYD